MKEPSVGSYYRQVANRSNSVPRYCSGGGDIPGMLLNGEQGRQKSAVDDVMVSNFVSSSHSPTRGRNRDRSQSTDASQHGSGYEKRRRDLNELEHRRRYVATILERYYSHPSNRQNSLPSTVREQLLNELAPGDEERRRVVSGEAPPVAVDDSASEVSSAVSCNRAGAYNQSGSARATPDSSPFYDEEQDDRSSTLTAGSRNGGKKKSRFFRSSSMRSLKKWMNKLRGRVNTNPGGSGRKERNAGSESFSPAADAASNGIAAPSHDSGLETPSDTSLNHNLANLHLQEHWDSADAAVASGRNRSRNLSAMVPPIADIPTPALCSIVNHGNTCYINAVVQCLSNTDLLAEYFLSGQYLTDLRNNLRNADRYGSQGNVTLALARFFKALWFNKYTPDVSSNFKSIVERYSEQYRGNQQQDAQEFFYWLADRVHEDLNVAVKRRYKLHKSRSKNEDELAAAAMEKHLEAHNSFISARFHGLFLSTVTCPVCRKQSMKPDPFMCISLPVSQCTKRPLFVVVVFINRQPRQVRFGLNADVTATFLEVKKCLADATDLGIDQILLCEMNECGFQTTLVDHHEVMSLGHTKCIWAFEIPLAARSPVNSRDDELVILVANQLASSSGNGLRFGSPSAFRVSREATYSDLFRSALFALRPQLRTNVAVQDIPTSAFRMRIVDDFHPFVFIPNDVSLPLYTQSVDNALMNLTVNSAPVVLPHLKLMLEWQREAKERYANPLEERIVDHVSAQDLRDQEENPEVQGLHDCLAEYTRPEACQWYCPDCHRRQDSAAKRIVFYWLPDVLVLHLKRFKQLSSGQLVKLDSTVWFPVSDLDLSDYTHQSISRNQRRLQQQQRLAQNYRTQNGELYVDTRPSQNLYDLYAVCNHSGHSPHSGHYTAFCRNPVNGRWYCFDDQNVTAIRERDLVTSGAYLLFYERRQLRKGSEGHNSAESGFVDHWFFRIYTNQLLDGERRSSYSSKDTSDGAESNGVASVGTNGQKSVPADANQRPLESNFGSTPASAELTARSKLVVELPGNDATKNSMNGQSSADSGKDGSQVRGDTVRNGASAGNAENGAVRQLIAVDLPTFTNVLSLGYAVPESFEETSPTSNEESTTVTAESSSLDAEGLGGRRDAQSSGNRPTIGRVLSAPYDDRNGQHDVFAVQKHQTTTALVKLNEKPPTLRSDITEEAESVTGSSTVVSTIMPSTSAKAGVKRDSSSLDVGAHRFPTCSVVETDL